jgi:hypothetical protein
MKKALLSCLVLFTMACSPQKDAKQSNDDQNDFKPSTAFSVQIKSQSGFPVANAQLLLGIEYADERFFTADENGVVQIPANLWQESMAITIGAENFIRASYLDMEPGAYDLVMNELPKERNYGVSGITKGFGSLKKDGWADFSMVAPSFDRQQLIGFELSHVISDQMDTMTIYGQDISIPSNISFPKQKESYGIFPVTLDKPSYRMPFYFPGDYQLAAIHGRFPFKEVVGKMRDGQSVFEVVNDFQFKQVGLTNLSITGSDHKADLEINHIQFKEEKSIATPAFANDDILMYISLNQNDKGYFPSGLRRVEPSSSAKLQFAEGFEHHLLAVLTQESSGGGKAKISNKMSIQIMPLNSSAPVSLLNRVESPVVNGTSLEMRPPERNRFVRDGGTYLSLTSITTKENPHVEMYETRKLWEVYADRWVEAVDLPQWPTGLSQNTKLRWEVMFLGSDSEERASVGPSLIRKASHVSRNTVDL